jgi:hypothetical protein
VATALRLRPSRAARADSRRWRSSGTRSNICFTNRCYHFMRCDSITHQVAASASARSSIPLKSTYSPVRSPRSFRAAIPTAATAGRPQHQRDALTPRAKARGPPRYLLSDRRAEPSPEINCVPRRNPSERAARTRFNLLSGNPPRHVPSRVSRCFTGLERVIPHVYS